MSGLSTSGTKTPWPDTKKYSNGTEGHTDGSLLVMEDDEKLIIYSSGD